MRRSTHVNHRRRDLCFPALSSASLQVVVAIHQPSSKMFDAFDHVLLLADGRTCYYGSPRGVGAYLRAVGFAPAEGDDTPAADFALELLHQPEKKEKLIAQWDGSFAVQETYMYLQQQPGGRGPEQAPEAGDARCASAQGRVTVGEEKADVEASLEAPSAATHGYASSWWTQFGGLYVRAFRSSKYGRFTPLKLSETALISLVAGACWFQMPATEGGLSRLESGAGRIQHTMLPPHLPPPTHLPPLTHG